jgi:hypothetical protein
MATRKKQTSEDMADDTDDVQPETGMLESALAVF